MDIDGGHLISAELRDKAEPLLSGGGIGGGGGGSPTSRIEHRPLVEKDPDDDDDDDEGDGGDEAAHPDKDEKLTCKEACFRARRRCGQIGSIRDVIHWIYDHRQSLLFSLVLCSLGFLLFFGSIFYYQPRSVDYRNTTVPVLHGFDCVAYHNLGMWSHGIKGRPGLSYTFHNWTDERDGIHYSYSFWFTSELNRELFIRDPWKYAPRFGGFSTYLLARQSYWNKLPDPSQSGWHAPAVHPDAFVMYRGALYMDYSLDHKKMFLHDPEAVIKTVEAKWIRWYGSLHDGPFNNFAVRGAFSQGDDSDSSNSFRGVGRRKSV